jgi:hypothetical protein
MAKTDAPPKPASAGNGPISKDAWAGLGVHRLTLPSGAVVRARIPDLSMLLANDMVPQELRAAALTKVMDEIRGDTNLGEEGETQAVARDDEKDFMQIKDTVALHLYLVQQMLVEPELELEDLERINSEDLTFLISIARRERNRDAAGVKLGVARIDEWATFQHEHECPEGCEKCEAALEQLSTARVGDLSLLRLGRAG